MMEETGYIAQLSNIKQLKLETAAATHGKTLDLHNVYHIINTIVIQKGVL